MCASKCASSLILPNFCSLGCAEPRTYPPLLARWRAKVPGGLVRSGHARDVDGVDPGRSDNVYQLSRAGDAELRQTSVGGLVGMTDDQDRRQRHPAYRRRIRAFPLGLGKPGGETTGKGQDEQRLASADWIHGFLPRCRPARLAGRSGRNQSPHSQRPPDGREHDLPTVRSRPRYRSAVGLPEAPGRCLTPRTRQVPAASGPYQS